MLLAYLHFLTRVAPVLPHFQQLNEIRFVVLIFIILMTSLNNIGLELDAEGFHFSSQRLNGYGSD
jgi:hypothetical protein